MDLKERDHALKALQRLQSIDWHPGRTRDVPGNVGAAIAQIEMQLAHDETHGPGPVTVAVRVCSCGQFMGTALWTGEDSHPGEPWTLTHGVCQRCFDATHGQPPKDAA